uniref:Uncharacterized protein n=1 Tax=Catharus ustulatus TaxID=91951 RepID=A0A8C3U1V7_CATUS
MGVVGPGPESTAARGAQRDAPYSTSASRNRLDTAQIATTSHTLVAALAAAPPTSTPTADRDPDPDDAKEDPAASAASLASSSDTLSVAVAERAGSPWSRTTISSVWRAPSASSSGRAVLTSPL